MFRAQGLEFKNLDLQARLDGLGVGSAGSMPGARAGVGRLTVCQVRVVRGEGSAETMIPTYSRKQ